MCLKSRTCLCGVHVSTGTRAIAIWGLCLHFVLLLWTVFVRYEQPSTEGNGQIGSTIKSLNVYWLLIAINLCLLMGNLYKKPLFYWPYLIFMLSSLLFSIIFVAGVVLFGSFAIFIGDSTKFDQHKLNINLFGESTQNSTSTLPPSTQKADLKAKMEMALMLAIISSILIGMTILQGYLLSVVFRGYRYLKQSIVDQLPSNQLELYEQKY